MSYLSYEKNTLADTLRVEPTIHFMEKNVIFFENVLWPFYGQSSLRLYEVLWKIFHYSY